MAIWIRPFSAFKWLPVFLALGACAFKKDTGNTPIIASTTVAVESQKLKNFCEDVALRSTYNHTQILLLSTSIQAQDMCYVWKHLNGLLTEQTNPSDSEILENFSKAIVQRLESDEDISKISFDNVAKGLTKLSIHFNGVAHETVIKINNFTINSKNNISLIPHIVKSGNFEILFTNTDGLTLDAFNVYWTVVSEKITKAKICTPETLLKILEKKRISSHITILGSGCNISLPADGIIDSRAKLSRRITDNEVSFFQSAIRTNVITYNPNLKSSKSYVLSKAIISGDKNLFILTNYLNIPPALAIKHFLTAISAKVDIEPLLKKLTYKEFGKILTWEAFEESLQSPHFLTFISLLEKYSLVPTSENTQKILEGLKKNRPLFGNHYVDDKTVVSIWRYLRSTTLSGFFSVYRNVDLANHELKLLINRRVNSPTVYNNLENNIAAMVYDLNVNSDGSLHIYVSLDRHKTPEISLKVGGSVVENIIIKKTTTDINEDYLFYLRIDNDAEILFVSVKNFEESLKTDEENYNFTVNCRSFQLLNSCETLKEKYGPAMKSAANAIRKTYLDKIPAQPN